MHKLDNAIFSRDWFVQASQEFNYRTYFVDIMTLISEVLGLKQAFFVITLIVTFISYLFIYLIVVELFSSKVAALIATFVIMFIPFQFSLYPQPLIDHNLLPRSINMLFLLAALYFYLLDKRWYFLLAITASIPFHLMQSAFFVFSLLVSHAIVKGKAGLRFIATTVFVSCFAAFFFFYRLILGGLEVSAEAKQMIFHALAVIRNPELAQLKHLDISPVVFQISLVCLFFVLLRGRLSAKQKSLLWVFPGIFFLIILQYVLVGVFHSYSGSFFFARSLVFFNIILILFVSKGISFYLQKKGVLKELSKSFISSLFIAPLAFLSASLFCATKFSKKAKSLIKKPFVVLISILLSVMFAQLFFYLTQGASAFSFFGLIQNWSPILLSICIYSIISTKAKFTRLFFLLLVLAFVWLQFLQPVDNDLNPIMQAIQQTPKDSVILGPPELTNEVWFKGQRSAVVNWDVIPSSPQGVIEWRTRILDLANNSSFDSGSRSAIIKNGYDSFSADQLLALAKKYNADFVLTRKQIENCSPLFAANKYYLYNATCVAG